MNIENLHQGNTISTVPFPVCKVIKANKEVKSNKTQKPKVTCMHFWKACCGNNFIYHLHSY